MDEPTLVMHIPIKFQFIKQTQGMIKQESKYIEEKIAAPLLNIIIIQGETIRVQHTSTLLKTMLDEKVALLQKTNLLYCYICKTKPKDVNSLSAVELEDMASLRN